MSSFFLASSSPSRKESVDTYDLMRLFKTSDWMVRQIALQRSSLSLVRLPRTDYLFRPQLITTTVLWLIVLSKYHDYGQ